MIIDHRTYTLQPGTVPQYFKAYEEEGMAIQVKHLVNMIGYFTTETGPLNQVIHMWAYENAGDREHKRANLQADPEWRNYVAKIRPLILTQENKIITPAPFCKIPMK